MDRRNFLKTVPAIAAGLSIAPVAAAKYLTTERPLKSRVRSRTMLAAYKRVVMAIAHLSDEERRRVLKAAGIICGEAP